MVKVSRSDRKNKQELIPKGESWVSSTFFYIQLSNAHSEDSTIRVSGAVCVGKFLTIRLIINSTVPSFRPWITTMSFLLSWSTFPFFSLLRWMKMLRSPTLEAQQRVQGPPTERFNWLMQIAGRRKLELDWSLLFSPLIGEFERKGGLLRDCHSAVPWSAYVSHPGVWNRTTSPHSHCFLKTQSPRSSSVIAL